MNGRETVNAFRVGQRVEFWGGRGRIAAFGTTGYVYIDDGTLGRLLVAAPCDLRLIDRDGTIPPEARPLSHGALQR